MPANPFKPTAGKMPPILIGRDDIVADFSEGLDNGAGAPGRLMLITGQRGYGKTVLLTELGRVAAARGWMVVSETASAGVCGRIIDALRQGGPQVSRVEVSPSVDVAGVGGLSLGSVSLERRESALTLRRAIGRRLERMKPGKGILFTIDEAQAASRADLVDMATAVQHVIRDQDMLDVPDAMKHGIAFVFAALPFVVDDLLNDEVLTFLRRCLRRNLGDVLLPDVRNAYVATVTSSGKTIDDKVAMAAAEGSGGYPYMVQLVGYYMWQSAQRRHSDAIEMGDVERASADAVRVFQDAVCAPALRGLTEAQRSFVAAMARDWPHPSMVADIAARTGKSSSWASKYRASLIGAQVIEPAGRGRVAYSIPYFGEYMNSAPAMGARSTGESTT